MDLDLVRGVVVYYDSEQRNVYLDILRSVGLEDIVLVEAYDFLGRECGKFQMAQAVAHLAGDGPSVVISQRHAVMTFCYNDGTTTLVFDRNNDSYSDYGFHDSSFQEGNFLHWRNGLVFIVGTLIGSDRSNFTTLSCGRSKNLVKKLDDTGTDRIFLSFEVDVLKRRVCSAHQWPGMGGFSYERVLELSLAAIKGRNLRGINIAGYCDWKEALHYKSSEMLKDYLSHTVPLLSTI